MDQDRNRREDEELSARERLTRKLLKRITLEALEDKKARQNWDYQQSRSHRHVVGPRKTEKRKDDKISTQLASKKSTTTDNDIGDTDLDEDVEKDRVKA